MLFLSNEVIMQNQSFGRRAFLRSAAVILPERVRGANDRVNVAFVGVGVRGKRLMEHTMTVPALHIAAVCDVKQDAREKAVALAAKGGHQPRALAHFREVLEDKSIDIVTIATPDHWHAYLTIEACKAGKDVYVEKPLCAGIGEGLKMVEAARKYHRIVETGTWQRSADHFQEAARMIREGRLGKLFLARAFNYFWLPAEGDRNPPDSAPPPGIDWDLWLGPAPKRPYNPARAEYGSYRKYWDYGGGVMTDWGVHWIDIVQMAMNEALPISAAAFGGKVWYTDSRDVPDTLQATFEYPDGILAVFETRAGNRQSLFGKDQGIVFHASKATMVIDRQGYQIIPEPNSDVPPATVKAPPIFDIVNRQWRDFLDCVRTRRRTASDVETCFRSTSTCLLANAALRAGLRVHWDGGSFRARESGARGFLEREHRAPWTLI
jgi:predicted dehydrogenase